MEEIKKQEQNEIPLVYYFLKDKIKTLENQMERITFSIESLKNDYKVILHCLDKGSLISSEDKNE